MLASDDVRTDLERNGIEIDGTGTTETIVVCNTIADQPFDELAPNLRYSYELRDEIRGVSGEYHAVLRLFRDP